MPDFDVVAMPLFEGVWLSLVASAVVRGLIYRFVVRPVVPPSERYTPGSWPGIVEATSLYRAHCERHGLSLRWWRVLWFTRLYLVAGLISTAALIGWHS